jgi:hypothetical protein
MSASALRNSVSHFVFMLFMAVFSCFVWRCSHDLYDGVLMLFMTMFACCVWRYFHAWRCFHAVYGGVLMLRMAVF